MLTKGDINPIIMDLAIDYKMFMDILRDYENKRSIENIRIKNLSSQKGDEYLEITFDFSNRNQYDFNWFMKYDKKTNVVFINDISLYLKDIECFSSKYVGDVEALLNIFVDITKKVTTTCIFSVGSAEKTFHKLVKISDGKMEDYVVDIDSNNKNIMYNTVKDFLKENVDIQKELAEKTQGTKVLKEQVNALGLKLIELKMKGSDLLNHDTFEYLLSQCCLLGADNPRVLSIYKLIE